jgi:hypothetical protein
LLSRTFVDPVRRTSISLLEKGGETPMVAANKKLLKVVRRLAVKDELAAMRLRGQLVSAGALSMPPAPPRPSTLT